VQRRNGAHIARHAPFDSIARAPSQLRASTKNSPTQNSPCLPREVAPGVWCERAALEGAGKGSRAMRQTQIQQREYPMKHNVLLTVASLLSILFMTFHLTDDIVRGMEPGTLSNLTALPIVVVWLYGTLVLAQPEEKRADVLADDGRRLSMDEDISVKENAHNESTSGCSGPKLHSMTQKTARAAVRPTLLWPCGVQRVRDGVGQTDQSVRPPGRLRAARTVAASGIPCAQNDDLATSLVLDLTYRPARCAFRRSSN